MENEYLPTHTRNLSIKPFSILASELFDTNTAPAAIKVVGIVIKNTDWGVMFTGKISKTKSRNIKIWNIRLDCLTFIFLLNSKAIIPSKNCHNLVGII